MKRSVFRVCQFARLIELLKGRQIVLVRPRLWDDPFENFLLQMPMRFKTGMETRFAAHNRVFAQCWSFTKESDAMWRIYAPEKDGIKIRSTVRKLGDVLWASCRDNPGRVCFVGKVRYLSRHKLNDEFVKELRRSTFSDGPMEVGCAKSLLIKRFAFRHENEVRVIFYDKRGTHNNDVFAIDVDPSILVDEIIFDPRMTPEEYEIKKAELVSYGYPASRIKRSGLYDPPKFVLNF